MKILARANKKLRGNGKFYTIPEPTKSWFYVTECDRYGYFKAKTIGCSGNMGIIYGARAGDYTNVAQGYLKEFEINNGVTSISKYAFSRCSELTSVTIPNSVTSIRENAFQYCSYLKSIAIPDSVTGRLYSTFDSCSSLTSITFGSSITSLEGSAFYNCSNCLLFDFRKATQVPTLSTTSVFQRTNDNKKIVVPDSLYEEWITATNWSSTTNNIVTSIIKASDYEASL